MFLPHPRVKVRIVESLRNREVACSASDRQGSNFESCVWRTVSSQSSHHPQEVLLAQFSLYVQKGDLKPDSFHLFLHGTLHCSFSNFIMWNIHFKMWNIHLIMWNVHPSSPRGNIRSNEVNVEWLNFFNIPTDP